MTYTIEKVTTLIGARRYGDSEGNIGFLLTDSRSLCFPEETLFFALQSERNDGHNYIPELYRRGVRNFVVSRVPKGYASDYPGANFLKVVSTLEALQRLAERHRDEFDIPIVGITGSNGKTMVKEWLYQLLSPGQRVTRSPRSYNSQIGVPLSVWLLNEQTQLGIFEAGISQPGEMLALRDIMQPTIAVLTNLGAAHQENFPSMEAKCKEKLTLFHDAEVMVYRKDNELVSRMVDEGRYAGEKLCWSTQEREAPFYVEAIEKEGDTTHVSYIYKGVAGEYTLPFIDDASVANSITCAVVARRLGLSAEDLNARMRSLEPVAGGEGGAARMHAHQRQLQLRHQLTGHSPRLHEPPSRPPRTQAHAHIERHLPERALARGTLRRGIKPGPQTGRGEVYRHWPHALRPQGAHTTLREIFLPDRGRLHTQRGIPRPERRGGVAERRETIRI